jgi:hypothetical protein
MLSDMTIERGKMRIDKDKITKEMRIIKRFPCLFVLTVLTVLAPISGAIWFITDQLIYKTRLENSESSNRYYKDKMQRSKDTIIIRDTIFKEKDILQPKSYSSVKRVAKFYNHNSNTSPTHFEDSLFVRFSKLDPLDSNIIMRLLFVNNSKDECSISEIFFSTLNDKPIPIPALDPKTKERIEPFLLKTNQPIYKDCLFNLQPIANKNKSYEVDWGLNDTCRIGVWAKYPNRSARIGKTIDSFIVYTQQGKVKNIVPDIKDSNQTDFYPNSQGQKTSQTTGGMY